MRHATRLGTAGVLALTVVAGSVWAGSATATTTPETSTPEASTETLVVGRTGDIDNLDPHLATAFQTIDALELVYDSLTELAPDSHRAAGTGDGLGVQRGRHRADVHLA